MIILIGGQKGGPGKTTIAANLAVMRALNNNDVFLYDIDEQATATLWASIRDEDGVQPRIHSAQKVLDKRIPSPGVVIMNSIRDLSSKYGDIIIDAGGADSEIMRGALSVCDVAVFPLQPSSFDLWTAETADRMIAQAGNPDKKGIVVLNKVSTNPGAAREEIADADAFLSDYKHLKRSTTVIYLRKAVQKSQTKGLGIVEYKPSDDKAIAEITALYNEVFNVQN